MLKKYKKFLISPLIVIGILLIIYAIKGIYPFGNLTIANGDMGQSYMPFYYFLYDIVHNGKTMLYDYTLGMGSNMYGGFVIDGLFAPSAFIILLNSRANIPYMFSFVMIAKMAFIALTSYILFNKLNKENNFYNIIFSVLYALSGYSLMYNTNLMWLDVVGLFPLFILATKYMLETNKTHWYAIVLALMLIFNYNLAYMVLMFIIFVIPIYIRFGIEKENRKRAVYNVIIGTILSVGLSAFAFIPAFIQTMTSYRMAGTVQNTVTNINLAYKVIVFLFYALPAYGYFRWAEYEKEDKKAFKIIGISLIFSAILPIIFERINLLWHTGSYQMFPFRYGFIPTLLLYMGALRYFGKFAKNTEIDKKSWKTVSIIFIVFTAISGIFAAQIINNSTPAFSMTVKMYVAILDCLISALVATVVAHFINEEKTRKILISIITIIQVATYTYAYIGVKNNAEKGIEWSDKQIFTSNKIYEKTQSEQGTNYKIKDLTASTTENCSLVYNIPSMSTFLHIIPTEQVLNYRQLGYSGRKTQLNDFGGTLISDAIYGVKYILSKEELPEQIYTFIEDIDDNIKLYEYKQTLPIGILYNSEETAISTEIKDFDAQNYLYKKMFNKAENIIDIVSENQLEKIEEGKYKYTIQTSGAKELYINSKNELKNIKVNGKEIVIPIINDQNNTTYPTAYCNGILDLGYFENSTTVEIEFESQEEKLENIQIGMLDIEKYNQMFKENQNDINVEIKGNKIKINGNVDSQTKLFLPINYSKGWRTIKGEAQIEEAYNVFIGISLQEGNNEIELEFRPELFDISVKISLATILIMIIAYFVNKKFDIRNVKAVMIIFWALGIVIYIAAVFKVYIMSIVQTIISFF